MTLLILAAGMGSRFGGLKQIEPIGPTGEFIIDYSIYDAKQAGFDKIVFVIKEEMYDSFKETIGSRIENHIEVEYAFQKLDNIPINKEFNREKPWGTGQAVLAAKNLIVGNFAVINADDFYGKTSFEEAVKFMKTLNNNKFGLIGYKAVNTLTENGAVKRGVCEISNGKVQHITECLIEKENDKLRCETLKEGVKKNIDEDALVSMSFLLFTPKIFKYLEEDFIEFLKNIKDEGKEEFLIHDILENHIQSGEIEVELIETNSKWYGVTYKEDKEQVKKAVNDLIKKKVYKEDLWS